MIAALALSMGLAAPAWSGLADPMLEEDVVHVIPFYKIDANWSAFLVVADTSSQDLIYKGSEIHLKLFDAACNYKQDAIVEPSRTDAQFFALRDPTDANGQFGMLVSPSYGDAFLANPASQASGGSISPRLSVDPRGSIYLIWKETRESPSGHILFRRSTDRGQNWQAEACDL